MLMACGPSPVPTSKCSVTEVNEHKVLISDKYTGEIEVVIWKSTKQGWASEGKYGDTQRFLTKEHAIQAADNWCRYTKN